MTDFDLSRRVSVPTSRRPMDSGSIEYFLSREETVVRAKEYISGVGPSQECITR